MTEQEWKNSTSPNDMLRWLTELTELGEKTNVCPSDRKLRLFACACCRVNLHLSKDRVSEALVRAGEQLADGGRLTREGKAAFAARTIRGNGSIEEACGWLLSPVPALTVAQFVEAQARRRGDKYKEDGAVFADILRDIVGNPFRTVTLLEPEPPRPPLRGVRLAPVSWYTPLVERLAQAVYDERNPDGTLDTMRLAVLSDAMIDAGCPEEVACDCLNDWCTGRVTNPLLRHLRSNRPRYRGDHVIDLLLRKE